MSGPSTLAEALDVAMLECLHAGRPSVDIVRGDINMARPPLSSFKYMSLSRFGRSSGFFSGIRVAPQIRAAPCFSVLLLVAQRCPRCCSLRRIP